MRLSNSRETTISRSKLTDMSDQDSGHEDSDQDSGGHEKPSETAGAGQGQSEEDREAANLAAQERFFVMVVWLFSILRYRQYRSFNIQI